MFIEIVSVLKINDMSLKVMNYTFLFSEFLGKLNKDKSLQKD